MQRVFLIAGEDCQMRERLSRDGKSNSSHDSKLELQPLSVSVRFSPQSRYQYGLQSDYDCGRKLFQSSVAALVKALAC